MATCTIFPKLISAVGFLHDYITEFYRRINNNYRLYQYARM